MKKNIIESPFLPAAKKKVCSHLKDIVCELEQNGTVFDWRTGIISDKSDGNILLSETDIDFDLVNDTFNIPNYINMDKSRGLIFCKKCWCSIQKKTKGKIFNSSIQPTYK